MEPLETSMDENEEDAASFDPSLPPLDRRILTVIKSCPDYTIRPARLASELGMSVSDACAELCGLLSAVGGGEKGASFRFEKHDNGAPPTMVFIFPPDFERRALSSRRRQDFRLMLRGVAEVAFKVVKIVTAFGLILSLLILTVAGIVGMVAAVIAMSRGGVSNQHRSEAMRRVRSMFFTMRQLLWCYAVFGSNFEGQDPFLQEIAMDLALFSSVCCGNPGSLFFWLRASQLSRRRARYGRGWGGRYQSNSTPEGVSLMQRGTWFNEEESSRPIIHADGDHRGVLSVAVEFLFGPTPIDPGPSENDRWKIRGAAIMQMSSKGMNGVSLEQLSPYSEYPAASLDQDAKVVAGGLDIVSHFNGVPVSDSDFSSEGPTKARFFFPELMAESNVAAKFEESLDVDDGSCGYLIYAKDVPLSHNWSTEEEAFLKERRYVLTRLELKQFLHCVGLGTLNAVGVVFFGQSLEPGGMLYAGPNNVLVTASREVLLPVLRFYAVLFFVLPAARLLVIVVVNAMREKRNQRRINLARAVKGSESTS